MGNGQPGEGDKPVPSVRVEVGDAVLDAPAPNIAGHSEGRSTGVMVAIVVGVLALLGVTLFALAPDPGQTADGAEISRSTSTTTEAPITTLATTPPVFPLDIYDSAEAPGFFVDVTRFGDVWVGHVYATDTDDLELLVSADGLEWKPVSSIPPGRVLGLAQVDERLVIAVDVVGDRGSFGDVNVAYDVRFFESADLVDWQPSGAYAPMAGTGEIFFAAIGDAAVGIPTRSVVDEPEFDELVEFFDGALQPELARQVCAVEYRTDDGARFADLVDCDGTLLGELRSDEVPELFLEPEYLAICVDEFRESARFREVLLIQSRLQGPIPAEAEITEVAQQLVGLGRMMGDAYLASGFSFSSNCGSADGVSFGSGVYKTTAEAGLVKMAEFDDLLDFGDGRPAIGADEEALIVLNSVNDAALARARPPYTDWASTPLTTNPDLRAATWSIAPDASLIFGATDRQWTFLTPGLSVVEELAIVGGQETGLILAADEYAIVLVNFLQRLRLVRVPLVDRE